MGNLTSSTVWWFFLLFYEKHKWLTSSQHSKITGPFLSHLVQFTLRLRKQFYAKAEPIYIVKVRWLGCSYDTGQAVRSTSWRSVNSAWSLLSETGDREAGKQKIWLPRMPTRWRDTKEVCWGPTQDAEAKESPTPSLWQWSLLRETLIHLFV